MESLIKNNFSFGSHAYHAFELGNFN